MFQVPLSSTARDALQRGRFMATWTQYDLARHSKVAFSTIIILERTGAVEPAELALVIAALNAAGVSFEDGIVSRTTQGRADSRSR